MDTGSLSALHCGKIRILAQGPFSLRHTIGPESHGTVFLPAVGDHRYTPQNPQRPWKASMCSVTEPLPHSEGT